MPEMSEDSLRTAIDAIRTRLHEELEAQLTHLSSRHQDEVAGARTRAAERAVVKLHRLVRDP